MNWNRITKGISQAVESAQSIGEKAMDLSNRVRNGLETLKNTSEVIKEDSSVINKGAKLAEIAKSALSQSDETPDFVSDSELTVTTDGVEISNCEQNGIATPVVLTSSADAVSALALMGTEIARAVQVCQIEETKRVEIRSRMEVEVARINAISNLLSDYLNKTFDERAELFDNYFAVLDKAIASGDGELMAATLGSINSLAAQSPFKNLADLSAVQQQLGQNDALWDI